MPCLVNTVKYIRMFSLNEICDVPWNGVNAYKQCISFKLETVGNAHINTQLEFSR